MKKSILFSLVALMMVSLNAANTYRVTPDAPGGGNGQSWEKPMTIEEAHFAVTNLKQHGNVILCKAGVYRPTVELTFPRNLTVKGGLAGTDDTTLDPNGVRAIIDGENRSNLSKIFNISAGDPSTFENLEIRNAYLRAFYKTGSGDITFKNCVFDSCGRQYPSNLTNERGAAGHFNGNNKAATIKYENCVFSRNTYEGSAATKVGNGIALAFNQCKRVMFDNCLFVSNGLGHAAVKSSTPAGKNLTGLRGAVIYSSSPLTVRNTEFRANTAGIYTGLMGAMGGVIYIYKSKGKSSFENCLFLGNSCEHCYTIDENTKEAGVIVVRSEDGNVTKDSIDVVNCTFAYNFTDGKITSAGIDVGSYDGTTANIKNTIFYGARKSRDSEKGRDIWVSSGCTANIDYCLFDSDGKENIEKCIAGAGTKTIGSNNIFGNPKFARAITAEEIDSIMVNTGSFYGYSDDAYETVFSKADVHAKNRKLTVDTGDLASPYSNEPTPNGKRVNLGYYGNTPEALSTVVGMRVIIR